MARILIVGGGCRGRRFGAEMVGRGHAVRATTRTEAGRAAIEASGAECWIGTPDRLATLRGALENVTIACWLLGNATGAPEQLQALHSSRLELFLTQAIDTTVRGFVYEVWGWASSSATATADWAPAGTVVTGEPIVSALTERNAIPAAYLRADPKDVEAWLAQARAAVNSLLDD